MIDLSVRGGRVMIRRLIVSEPYLFKHIRDCCICASSYENLALGLST